MPCATNYIAPKHLAFMEVNFSMLMHNNQIFRNDFVFSNFHLCKISAKIFQSKILLPTISPNVLFILNILYGFNMF